jgi:hypothetical protein
VSRLVVPRTLAAGALVGTATAVRTGSKCLVTVAVRTPPLVGVALRASGGAPAAQATFRDELVELARDTAELSWRELRRGLDDFDAVTRPAGERVRRRPYRVKA